MITTCGVSTAANTSPTNMATNIQTIYENRYTEGYDEGYSKGESEGGAPSINGRLYSDRNNGKTVIGVLTLTSLPAFKLTLSNLSYTTHSTSSYKCDTRINGTLVLSNIGTYSVTTDNNVLNIHIQRYVGKEDASCYISVNFLIEFL